MVVTRVPLLLDYLEQLDLEDQRRVRSDRPARSVRPIRNLRRNHDPEVTPRLHEKQPFSEAGDEATRVEDDGISIVGGVELGAIDQ